MAEIHANDGVDFARQFTRASEGDRKGGRIGWDEGLSSEDPSKLSKTSS